MVKSTLKKSLNVLIVGGQGTYLNGKYYTEFPDRALALDHIAEVAKVVEDASYNCVVCSGGFTKEETPNLSEAESILNYWGEVQKRPRVDVILDEVALDSAENIIFGLMALRQTIKDYPIERICFYSLWQFKKPRMTSLAKDLGIENQFFFRAFTDERKANAGPAALAGEQKQYESMKIYNDFLLRGKTWEEKRIKRYEKTSIIFNERDLALRNDFKKTFAALDRLKETKVCEFSTIIAKSPNIPIETAVEKIRNLKLEELKEAILDEIISPR